MAMMPSPCITGKISEPPLSLPGSINRIGQLFLPSSSNQGFRKRRDYEYVRSHLVRCVASSELPLQSRIFGNEKQLTGPQKLLEDLSAPARYAACAAIVTGALAAGFALGSQTKGTTQAAVAGALALGAVGGATAYAVNSMAPKVAAIKLHNAMVKHPNPTSLKREEVEEILNKFGVDKRNSHFIEELQDLYDRFVTSTIPVGNEDLKGDEAEKIIAFKDNLGLDDPEAAAVHIEVGRRLFRQRLETGDRDAAIEERRTFQKLVYVSSLVFGEASKFLLPWKRVFKVTDSQVEIAINDNAKRLFQSRLRIIGADINLEQVTDLRKLQLRVKLPDEIAGDIVKSHTQKQLEMFISRALELSKSRTRLKDYKQVVREMDNMLTYNASLTALGEKCPELPGLGPVSIMGGQYSSDRQMEDLKQLYRTYLNESFVEGILPEDKIKSLGHLKNIFGLGNREAEEIMVDVTTKVYRRRLSQAVSSRDLDAAPSKAIYLQNLCDSLHFDPEKASKVHEEIYRQKLEQCVADGSLSDEDVSALLRLRVLLCIPQETVDGAHADICGRLFAKAVDEAIAAGIDGYDADMKKAVRSSATGLRLSQDAAMEIASAAVRKVFLTYIKRSKTADSRTEAARELKKMVMFNSLVVTELIDDIKQDSPVQGVEKKVESVQPAFEDDEDDDDVKMLQTLRKTRPQKNLEGPPQKPPQKLINLKNDLELRDRKDLYRAYLLYCLSGEATNLPFGSQIVVQKDNNEFLRLGELGNLLGLTTKEVADVHKGLAEQAFRQQAQIILADGQLSKAKMEQLTELQQQLGLPSEAAQNVIRSITTTRMSGAIETAVNQGRLSVEEVKELREAGVNIDSMLTKEVRLKMFKKIVDGVFSSGTGDFVEEEIFVNVPIELGLDKDKARKIVEDLAKERLKNSLVQAVSLLRQKNFREVVTSLNNMLACDKVVRSDMLSWSVQGELTDLYCLYYKSSPSDEKLARVQELFGFDDSTAESLKKVVDSGGFGEEDEDFGF